MLGRAVYIGLRQISSAPARDRGVEAHYTPVARDCWKSIDDVAEVVIGDGDVIWIAARVKAAEQGNREYLNLKSCSKASGRFVMKGRSVIVIPAYRR
jgi:hypothetical protein